MKKSKLRSVLAIGLAVAVVIGVMAFTALAGPSDPTVTYNHSTQQFIFTNVSPYGDTHDHQYPDLFPDMKEMMPGDSVTQEIVVGVSNVSGGTVNLYLHTETHDNISDQELKDYQTLLSSDDVTLKVMQGTTELGSGSLATGVKLGAWKSTGSTTLEVILDISTDAGNELQGLQAAVGWVFTAEYVPDTGTTDPGGGGGGGGGGGTSATEIPEESIPLEVDPELEMDDHYAYIIGRNDGLVHPDAEITRAEVATIFFRMLTDESRSAYWSQTNGYSDVLPSAWYNNAVSTLSNAGIILGRPDGTFGPNDPITRAEFAVIAVRFFGGGYTGSDMFSDIAGHWANEEINVAAVRGFILGYTDGTFGPDSNIVRSEAITLMNRVLERKPHADYLLDDMVTWPDNQPGSWYYADIQEATNSHDYEFETDEDADTTYEVWTELLTNRDWAALEKEWSEANSGQTGTEVISSSGNEVYQ